MNALATTTPERFIGDFFTSFTEQILLEDGDPGPSVDRYYTPDIVQISDGVRLDRDRLIAHIRPVRKMLHHRDDFRYDVHEALASGDRIAARFTIHVRTGTGKVISTEVYLFGELAPDGRIRRTHQITRKLPTDGQWPPPVARAAGMIEATYPVLGMACHNCTVAVGEALERVPAVTAVTVDLAAETVTVTSDRALDRGAVGAAVAGAGYELG